MRETAADRRSRQEERRDRRSAVTDPDVVLAAGAALLGIRARTTHDLRARLVTLGYPPGLVDVTIERLLTLGYLDDDAYARAWVAGRDRSRPRGAGALRRELLRKGLGRELVDATLEAREAGMVAAETADGSSTGGYHAAGAYREPDHAHPGSSADQAAALRLLDRRRGSLLREMDPRKRRQRAYTLLARNGFDPGVCMDVTRSFVAGLDGTSDPDELSNEDA